MTPMSALRCRVGALLVVCVVGVGLAGARECAAQPCRAQWEGGFTRQEPDNPVKLLRAFTEHSSGRPLLFAGGEFVTIGALEASRVALWDGDVWSAMGQGVTGTIVAAIAFDDGSGPALYVAGDFTTVGSGIRGVARWRGNTWQPVGTPAINGFAATRFFGLIAHDEGSGPRIFGVAANGFNTAAVLRFDGLSWTNTSGAVLAQPMSAMASVTDGPLRGLYVGVSFYNIGGTYIASLGRWDGAAWSSLPGQPYVAATRSLATYAPLAEPMRLYVLAQGVGPPGANMHLFRWDGATWDQAPSELPRAPMRTILTGAVERLCFLDPAVGVSAWDGAAVSPIGPAQAGATAFEYFDAEGGEPERLYLCGAFPEAPAASNWDAPLRIASLRDDRWRRLDNAPVARLDWMGTLDLGDAPSLHGVMQYNSDRVLLRLDERRWTTVSVIPGVVDRVRRVVRFDRGLPPGAAGVYAALEADFHPYGNTSGPFQGLARWAGESWTPVGGGLTHEDPGFPTSRSGCRALEVHDDGQGAGPQLYACGSFNHAGDVEAFGVARWDGSSWSAVGEGLRYSVSDLRSFDDGDGAHLYAVGSFRPPGQFSGSGFARWDGVAWEHLARPNLGSGACHALGVQRVNGEARLIVLGDFGAARWHAGAWEPLTSPPDAQLFGADQVVAFGSGPTQRLAAWGRSGVAVQSGTHGGYPGSLLRRFALWSGERWTLPERDFVEGELRSIVPFDSGDGEALWVGGYITSVGSGPGAPGIPTRHVAAITAIDSSCSGDVNFDGVVGSADLNVVLSHYGEESPGTPYDITRVILPGDLNLDAFVDFFDLSLALASFGSTCE